MLNPKEFPSRSTAKEGPMLTSLAMTQESGEFLTWMSHTAAGLSDFVVQVQQAVQVRGEGQLWGAAREVWVLRPGGQAAGGQLFS